MHKFRARGCPGYSDVSLIFVGPQYRTSLCPPSGDRNFDVGPIFLENVCTSAKHGIRKCLGKASPLFDAVCTVRRNQLCKWTNEMHFGIFIYFTIFISTVHVSKDGAVHHQVLIVVYRAV